MCSSDKTPRSIGSVDKSEDLFTIFEKYVTTPVKIADYGPGLDIKTLKKSQRMFAEMQGVQHNLSFAPVAVKGALQKLAGKDTWGLTTKEQNYFAIAVGKRVRGMCRHLGQNMCKKTQPKWLGEFKLTVRNSNTAK